VTEIDKSFNVTRISDTENLTNTENLNTSSYYSSSVTDLFCILHELLNIILKFDTKIDTNLIKSKLLIYIAHVKNEYYKLYNKNERTRGVERFYTFNFKNERKYSISVSENYTPSDDLTIKSCILINNFQKSIELLDDIEFKLNTNDSNTIDTTLKSIVEVLEDNIGYMIKEYCKKFVRPFNKSCEFLKLQINNDNSAIMIKFVDDLLYRIFNHKLKICKRILFEAAFKKLLMGIFKTILNCIEETIILKMNVKNDLYSNKNDQNNNILFEKLEHIFSYNLAKCDQTISVEQHNIISLMIQRIIDFFSADEELLKKSQFTDTIEYKNVQATLELNHMPTSSLISMFIKTQKVQNNIDLTKSFGKIHLLCESKINFLYLILLIFLFKKLHMNSKTKCKSIQ